MVSSSPLCLQKRRSCKCIHRFLLIFASTSMILLLSSVFWSRLSPSNCPWHQFTEKLTHFHRDYSGGSGFQYIDSTFVPRGRMRALSFVGYTKNERNTSVIPLNLSVGPDSSNESWVSPSEASQVLEAFENKNSKTSVDESPEVVPNHRTMEWTGDDWRAPANPVSDKVSDFSESMASVATLSASDCSRNEIPSHDAGSKRQYPATSEDTPDSSANLECNTPFDSGTENIRVGGRTRGRIEQFSDGEELQGLTRSTAYTENMDSVSIPSRSAWLKGYFGGGKPVREQHRQLDKRWEEKLARCWEESGDEDEIGEFEDTGMGYEAGEMDIDEKWQTESEKDEIDNNDTFYETVLLEVPGELEEEISVPNEKTESIIKNPEISSDDFSTSGEGGRGAVVDEEDYEDVEMDEEVKNSGNSVDESAALTDDARCETCDVSSETTGVSEDFREAELAWAWTRGSGGVGGRWHSII